MKFLLVIIIFFIIFIIAEIGTIAFKMTGLSIETARFQAISLITNTGFTTSEAELIVRDRTRKKIAGVLMVTFYVSLPLIIATVLETFANGFTFINILIAIIGLYISYRIMRNHHFVSFIEQHIEKYITKYELIPQKTMQEILSVDSDYKIVEVVLENRKLTGKPLAKLALQEYEIIVLAIERGHELIPRPHGYHTLELGDKILLYGKLNKIEDIFGCVEDQCRFMDWENK